MRLCSAVAALGLASAAFTRYNIDVRVHSFFNHGPSRSARTHFHPRNPRHPPPRQAATTAKFNAVALDGTPAVFYYQPGTGADANNWAFYFVSVA